MVKRKRSRTVEEEDRRWLPAVEIIKADHPSWGYRRVWAYLTYRQNQTVNKKRIYRIMKENRLLAPQTRKRASRGPYKSKIKTDQPLKVWGIDMTKVLIPSWGWVYLMVVLDWGSRKIVGYELSATSRTDDWLKALDRALNEHFPNGVRGHGLKLVSDNGCQPTSARFMKTCHTLGIRQIFTTYSNPKGNANTERVIRTIKEDLVWPRDWYAFSQLETSLKRWVNGYNEDFPHSAIGYMTPGDYHRKHTVNQLDQTSSARERFLLSNPPAQKGRQADGGFERKDQERQKPETTTTPKTQ